MTTQTDDWMAPGDDVFVATLKPMWKWALVIAVFSFIALAVSTSFHQDVVRRPVSSLRSNDAVIALRLGLHYSPSLKTSTNTDSWIVLLDAQGKGTVASVDLVAGADVLWSDRGIFYGSGSRNYVTTDSGTQVSKSDNGTREEIQRYELPGGQLVTLVPKHWEYNDGDVQSDPSITTVETAGITGDFGQCGSRILAITDTKESPSIADAAFEAYAAQANNEDAVPEALTAVVQLNTPGDDAPRILAVTPVIDNVVSGDNMFACDGDVITLQSLEEVKPGTPDNMTAHERYRWVLRRWDLATGERTIIPVVDEDGNAIDLDRDHGMHASQALPGEQDRRFLGDDGRVWSVDLVSGRAKHLFSIPWNASDGNASVQLNETGIYLLEVNERNYDVTLTYRPWDGGDKREVFTTDALAEYIKTNNIFSGHRRGVQSFAVRPGWNGGAQ